MVELLLKPTARFQYLVYPINIMCEDFWTFTGMKPILSHIGNSDGYLDYSISDTSDIEP